MSDGRLSNLLEWLSEEEKDPAVLVPFVSHYLTHASPVVREGAVLAIGKHLQYPGVSSRLRIMAEEDPSPGVRKACAEVLEE